MEVRASLRGRVRLVGESGYWMPWPSTFSCVACVIVSHHNVSPGPLLVCILPFAPKCRGVPVQSVHLRPSFGLGIRATDAFDVEQKAAAQQTGLVLAAGGIGRPGRCRPRDARGDGAAQHTTGAGCTNQPAGIESAGAAVGRAAAGRVADGYCGKHARVTEFRDALLPEMWRQQADCSLMAQALSLLVPPRSKPEW